MEHRNLVLDTNREEAARIFDLPELLGKVIWEGDLAEMREDNPRRPRAIAEDTESK